MAVSSELLIPYKFLVVLVGSNLWERLISVVITPSLAHWTVGGLAKDSVIIKEESVNQIKNHSDNSITFLLSGIVGFWLQLSLKD